MTLPKFAQHFLDISTKLSNREPKLKRPLQYLDMYYGISDGVPKTLEKCGSLSSPPLTRERVRQLLNKAKNGFEKFGETPYKRIHDEFMAVLKDKKYIKYQDLIKQDFFKIKNNDAIYLSLLQDAGVQYIRKNGELLLFPEKYSPKLIGVLESEARRQIKLEATKRRQALRVKTVTYVDKYTVEKFHQISNDENVTLNSLYHKSLGAFLEKGIYKDKNFNFPKTKAWKSRMGLEKEVQVGIYLIKDLYEEVKAATGEASKIRGRKVSLMSFISNAFAWYARTKD